MGALVAGGVAFGTVKATENDTTGGRLADHQRRPGHAGRPRPARRAGLTSQGFDVKAVLAKVQDSVVSVEVGQQQGGSIYNTAAGSGFVLTADGEVLTNNHVVQGADAITVKFSDGKEYKATVVGRSPVNDVALIKLQDASGLKPVTLGDSSTLAVGDEVLAIGNALNLGDSPTVTLGIVSAKNRTIQAEGETLEGLLQTDAAINPGNSGGMLVNAAGEVVGIPSAGVEGANNIGFAIEINTVKSILDSLKAGNGGVVQGAFLGVGSVDVAGLDADTKSQYKVTATEGAFVQSVQPRQRRRQRRHPGGRRDREDRRQGRHRLRRRALGHPGQATPATSSPSTSSATARPRR